VEADAVTAGNGNGNGHGLRGPIGQVAVVAVPLTGLLTWAGAEMLELSRKIATLEESRRVIVSEVLQLRQMEGRLFRVEGRPDTDLSDRIAVLEVQVHDLIQNSRRPLR
jgi:hypothetical protein